MADESLADVVARGERLDSLVRLRDWIAVRLEETKSARDLASLTKQLTDVLREIDELERSKSDYDPLATLTLIDGGQAG